MAQQRGLALILVLLVLALLAAAGLGLSLASSLARMSAANRAEAVALVNAAESALELAASALSGADLDAVLAGIAVSAWVDGPPGLRLVGADAPIDLSALTHQLTCGRADPCTDAQVAQSSAERPWGANNPRWRPFLHQPLNAPPLPALWHPIYIIVWIGDDAREGDGEGDRDGAGPGEEGRYTVRARAEAFGPRGGRRAIEAELARVCTDEPGGAVCRPGTRVQSWRLVSSGLP